MGYPYRKRRSSRQSGDGLPRGNVRYHENKLAELQNERAKLLTNKNASKSEYEHLISQITRFLAPVQSDIDWKATSADIYFRYRWHIVYQDFNLHDDGLVQWLSTESGGFSACIGMIEERITQKIVQRRKLMRKSSLLKFFGPLLSNKRRDIERKVESLAASEERLRNFLTRISPLEKMSSRAVHLHNGNARLNSIDDEINSYQLALAREMRKPESKMEILRARAAQNEQENREATARIRDSIPRTDFCPYCDLQLGEAHLDHIVPVSHGGRPHRGNLVYICVSCNLRKSDLTLFEFAEKFGMKHAVIARRLKSLGKRP
jgi:5-methylcytosine-specific restriction endonuclease McrA